MMQTLRPEQPRCHGWDCPQRARCLHYAERSQHTEITPFMSHLCNEGKVDRLLLYAGTGRWFPWGADEGSLI